MKTKEKSEEKVPLNCELKRLFAKGTYSGRTLAFSMIIDPQSTCREVCTELLRLLSVHENLGYGCIRGHKPKLLSKDYCSKCKIKDSCIEMLEHDKKLFLPPKVCLSCSYYK